MIVPMRDPVAVVITTRLALTGFDHRERRSRRDHRAAHIGTLDVAKACWSS
jgi:hypothetical protein